jgi:hypothetical protein
VLLLLCVVALNSENVPLLTASTEPAAPNTSMEAMMLRAVVNFI